MNRDDIIRMAREAGLGTALCHNSVEGERVWIEGADWHDELERFAALVAAAEREECAKECDKIAHRNSGLELGVGASWCAAAIRARGQA